MKNKYLSCFLLLAILLFGLWLRTFNLGNRYAFEWDQNDDAEKVMKIIEGQPTLIGPRVAGADSFFVAPWHYYFLVPFYVVGKGDPISGAYAATAVGMVTILVYYWIGKKMWGQKEGLIAAWAGAIAFSIVSWNVMYTPLLSIIVFYLGNKLLEGGKKMWMALALAIFAGTTHLVPMSLVIMVFLTYFLVKKKPTLKNISLGLGIGLLSFTPLFIFDLRHDFLITHKLILFLTASGVGHKGILNWLSLRGFFREFSLIGVNLNIYLYYFERVFLFAAVIAGVLMTKENNKRIWYLFWILFPAVVLLFYWKFIPEYYFGVSFALVPLFLALVSKKNRLIICLFLILMSIAQVYRVINFEKTISLNDKKILVTFLTNYVKGKHFNFSYDIPIGEEMGYPYLFAWKKQVPENIPEARLYSIAREPIRQGKILFTHRGLNIVEK